MKKLALIVLLFVSAPAFAADPPWFDRPQATYTSSHLVEVYDFFVRDLAWSLGTRHPLYRESYYAYVDVRDIYSKLRSTTYPFDPLYALELDYYRGNWSRVKTEWYHARIADRQLQQAYAELGFLSDKLHRTFNATSPTVWVGNCRVVRETVWGADLQSYYGTSRAQSKQQAISLAREEGVRQCERGRGGERLQRCVVDENRCTAARR